MLLLFLVALPLIILIWCLLVNSKTWWNRTGYRCVSNCSPCCGSCLDSCCCPVLDHVVKYIPQPFIRPGKEIRIKKNIKTQNNNSEIPKKQNTQTHTQTEAENLKKNSMFISDSPVPNVKFYPINTDTPPLSTNIGSSNPTINDSNIKRKVCPTCEGTF